MSQIRQIIPCTEKMEAVVELRGRETVRRTVIGFALVHDGNRDDDDQDQITPVVFDPEDGCAMAVPEAYDLAAESVRYELR